MQYLAQPLKFKTGKLADILGIKDDLFGKLALLKNVAFVMENGKGYKQEN